MDDYFESPGDNRPIYLPLNRTSHGLFPRQDGCHPVSWSDGQRLILQQIIDQGAVVKLGHRIRRSGTTSVLYSLMRHFLSRHPHQHVFMFFAVRIRGEMHGGFLQWRSDIMAWQRAQGNLVDFDTFDPDVFFLEEYDTRDHTVTLKIFDYTPFQSWNRFLHPKLDTIIIILFFAQGKDKLPIPVELVRTICDMLFRWPSNTPHTISEPQANDNGDSSN